MSQLITKFIEDNAVTDAKIRLRNNAPLRARNALGTADVDLFKLDSSDSFTVMSQPRAAAALALQVKQKIMSLLSGQKTALLVKVILKMLYWPQLQVT